MSKGNRGRSDNGRKGWQNVCFEVFVLNNSVWGFLVGGATTRYSSSQKRSAWSKFVVLVKMGELVSTFSLDGSHSREVPIALFLIDLERWRIFVQAGLESAILSFAHRTRAEVQTARAKLERHLSKLVESELACGCQVRWVVQVSLWSRLHHNDILWVKLQVLTYLSHICSNSLTKFNYI